MFFFFFLFFFLSFFHGVDEVEPRLYGEGRNKIVLLREVWGDSFFCPPTGVLPPKNKTKLISDCYAQNRGQSCSIVLCVALLISDVLKFVWCLKWKSFKLRMIDFFKFFRIVLKRRENKSPCPFPRTGYWNQVIRASNWRIFVKCCLSFVPFKTNYPPKYFIRKRWWPGNHGWHWFLTSFVGKRVCIWLAETLGKQVLLATHRASLWRLNPTKG